MASWKRGGERRLRTLHLGGTEIREGVRRGGEGTRRGGDKEMRRLGGEGGGEWKGASEASVGRVVGYGVRRGAK